MNNNTQGAVALLGRILLAALFLASGLGKLAAAGATQAYIASVGIPFPVLAYIAAIVLEVGAGLLLLGGYRTRVAAIALAGYCVLTAVLFHSNLADQNQAIHLLKDIAIAGGLLQLAAFGAGRFSLDGRYGPSIRSTK
ncbi:MAG: LysR family transcriptional regulator [Ramlibacter sp.]|nr:LysR family transcriptional regulator [Ramlibacter sp.]